MHHQGLDDGVGIGVGLGVIEGVGVGVKVGVGDGVRVGVGVKVICVHPSKALQAFILPYVQ